MQCTYDILNNLNINNRVIYLYKTYTLCVYYLSLYLRFVTYQFIIDIYRYYMCGHTKSHLMPYYLLSTSDNVSIFNITIYLMVTNNHM